jgi:hypothetical protein
MRKAVSDGRTRNERSEQNQQRPIERLARARVVEERVVGVCKGEVTVARACINEEQGERASMHASIGGGRTGTAQGENMEGAALHLTQHAQRSRWMDHGWADGRRRKTNGIVFGQRFPAFTPQAPELGCSGSSAPLLALQAARSPAAATHPSPCRLVAMGLFRSQILP